MGPRAVLDTYTIPIQMAPFTAETKDERIIRTTSYFLHDVLTHTIFSLSSLLPKLRQNMSQISYDLNSLHKGTSDSSDTVVLARLFAFKKGHYNSCIIIQHRQCTIM